MRNGCFDGARDGRPTQNGVGQKSNSPQSTDGAHALKRVAREGCSLQIVLCPTVCPQIRQNVCLHQRKTIHCIQIEQNALSHS